jgi:hypothetical protein
VTIRFGRAAPKAGQGAGARPRGQCHGNLVLHCCRRAILSRFKSSWLAYALCKGQAPADHRPPAWWPPLECGGQSRNNREDGAHLQPCSTSENNVRRDSATEICEGFVVQMDRSRDENKIKWKCEASVGCAEEQLEIHVSVEHATYRRVTPLYLLE